MGFQITLFLALIVYLDVVMVDLPIWKQAGETPNLLIMFIVSIIGKRLIKI